MNHLDFHEDNCRVVKRLGRLDGRKREVVRLEDSGQFASSDKRARRMRVRESSRLDSRIGQWILGLF